MTTHTKNEIYINLENAQEIVDSLKDIINKKPDVITSVAQPENQAVGGTWEEVLNDVQSSVSYSGSKITSENEPVSQNVGDV